MTQDDKGGLRVWEGPKKSYVILGTVPYFYHEILGGRGGAKASVSASLRRGRGSDIPENVGLKVVSYL